MAKPPGKTLREVAWELGLDCLLYDGCGQSVWIGGNDDLQTSAHSEAQILLAADRKGLWDDTIVSQGST